ncbi:MAG TPA: BrnT family toxin [Rhizomicrobium sp.]|nr:BrnT family toxin [Rhizomicrobium sp.]
MEFEWDEAKRLSNLVKHGLDFADVARLDWARLKIERDWRFDYGEPRFIGVGHLDGEVVATAFTWRGAVVRIVSFRPASRKERARYGT